MTTKENILLTALELFAKNGYEAVSVNDIAARLGLTKGALYKHYRNKRDIFDSIVERMTQYDYDNAKNFRMPEGLFAEMPDVYKNTEIERLSAYTLAQFVFWTEDSFASNFRKMLSIERYRNSEMESMYQQFLGTGPVEYTADLFMANAKTACTYEQARELGIEFYSAVYMLIDIYDSLKDKNEAARILKKHTESFIQRLAARADDKEETKMITYPRSAKYSSPELMAMIMGPNPLKLEEELLEGNLIEKGARVCDLGSGTGLTSIFLVKEYGFTVYAADLWSDPEENRRFFDSQGIDREKLIPVKADARALPFEKEFFDAVVSVDSYNYFGRDPAYLGEKLLPFVRAGGYIYIAIPGMKKDCHDNLPEELLLSWTPEQMDFMHDTAYWRSIIEQTEGIEIISIQEMQSNKEVWDDWLRQENRYAVGDRKSMEAGAGKYLNFISMIIRKK